MPLSIAHGNGIKNFRAVTKIDALIWGAQAASLLFSAAGRKALRKSIVQVDLLSPPSCRRLQASSLRSPESNAQRRKKKGARWRTNGRTILILFVADLGVVVVMLVVSLFSTTAPPGFVRTTLRTIIRSPSLA